MITALWIVGYLTVGFIAARIFAMREELYRHPDFEDYMLLCLIVVFWAAFAPFAIVACACYGLGRLLTLPPRRERQQRRLDRTQRTIEKLERELDIK